jgi:RNA polymerase sigma-70 factor (ECF subfamily)
MTARDRSDRELLAAWARGDTSCGEQLFRRHYRGLYSFLGSKLSEGIDDVVQATFMTVLASADGFRGDSSFKTFLFGVARHKVLHYFRGSRERERPFDPGESSVASVDESPSRVVVIREEEQLLLTALRALPLDYQITLELHYWEDMTTREIAGVLETSPGTIKSRLHRARALLREQIEATVASEALRRSTLDGLEAWARSMRTRWGAEPG